MYKILVIDDEKDICDIVARSLVRHGYHVQCLTKGDKGLKAARGGDFDLIIVDWTIPELSGAGIVKGIRESQDIADRPIIVITGKRDPDFLNQSLDIGADDFLFKPFSMHLLTRKVDHLLHAHT